MRNLLALAVLALSASPLASAAERSETCGGSAWRGYYWCASVAKGSQSRAVIYYFHGHGGHAEGWPADNPELDALLTADPANAPAVISVSFGKHWFLSEVAGIFSAPKLETLPKIVAEAEASLPAPPATRALLGKSMGGFNAIQGAAKASDLFRKTAILCPAQPPLTPFASYAEVEAFIEKGRDYLRADLPRRWTKYFREEFTTPDSWAKHDPLALASRIAGNGKPIFLQADDRDIFGFYPNAVKFHEALKAASAKVDWHVTPNGWHCVLTKESTKALADFLLN
jgi:acetyl esterase/lipase